MVPFCINQCELESLVVEFYYQLFSAQDVIQPEEMTRFIPRKITDQKNDILNAPLTDDEVRAALFMMKPSKALGPDGFTTGFYQRHWNLLGPDICKAVIGFLNGGDMPAIVNNTILVLIPKVKKNARINTT
jgi:hypothetical protein